MLRPLRRACVVPCSHHALAPSQRQPLHLHPNNTRDALEEVKRRVELAVTLPVRITLRDVFDACCTELVVTAPLDTGGRGRPRVTFDVTQALSVAGLGVFMADGARWWTFLGGVCYFMWSLGVVGRWLDIGEEESREGRAMRLHVIACGRYSASRRGRHGVRMGGGRAS